MEVLACWLDEVARILQPEGVVSLANQMGMGRVVPRFGLGEVMNCASGRLNSLLLALVRLRLTEAHRMAG